MSKTGPVLRSANLYFDTRKEEELDYIRGVATFNYRKLYALKSVDVKEREDTITVSWWFKHRFIPCTFTHANYHGTSIRLITGTLKNEFWYRNEYVRLVLSFRQEMPRLYLIQGQRITDISNLPFPMLPYQAEAEEYLLPQLTQRWCAELVRANNQHHDVPDRTWGLERALNYIRHKWVRDLYQHTGEVPLIPRINYVREPWAVDTKAPSPRWSLQEFMDKTLGRASTRSTRRKMLELMQSDVNVAVAQAQSLNQIADLFDPSDWAEVLPVAGQLSVMDGALELDNHPFRDMTPQRRMRLVRDIPETPAWLVDDVFRMYYQRDQELAGRTWHEIHGNLVEEGQIIRRREQAERDRVLSEGVVDQGAYNEIDGVEVGKFQFLTPKKPLELEDWGFTLNHCIGSYAYEALRGSVLLFALTQGGTIVYTGAIDPRQKILTQFRGHRNAEVPEDLFASVVKVLVDHDLLRQGHSANEHYA